MTRVGKTYGFAVASIFALVAVRAAALGADPAGWLSWSSGIGTDEGFYTLDARHLVLFGTLARGNFHDRLLSPLLSVMQQAAFAAFGPSLMTARALDVLLGLLTVALMWLGLRAAFGTRAANAGALLLGFAPPFVLYNRLALQETPAAFWLAASFALWAVGTQARSRRLLMLAGMAAGLAFLCKSLAMVFFPALLWAAWRTGRRGRLALLLGLGVVVLGWGMLWQAPHHTPLARMALYYKTHQFAPHSAHSLWLNIRRAGVGDRAGILRGMLPYLLLFVPVPCVLAASRGHGFAQKTTAEQVLWLWLAGGVLFCALSSYAPDRYYVLFLPPLCALAGLALASLASVPRRALVAAAFFVSAAWLGIAWHGRTWTALHNAHTLARLLPPRSVVVGDMAPAVCMGTTLDAAPVQFGLSNDIRPVETLNADYLAITRAPVYTRWWQARYPNIVQPARRVASLAVGTRWIVDIYKAKP